MNYDELKKKILNDEELTTEEEKFMYEEHERRQRDVNQMISDYRKVMARIDKYKEENGIKS